jgi:hypothetical protein
MEDWQPGEIHSWDCCRSSSEVMRECDNITGKKCEGTDLSGF